MYQKWYIGRSSVKKVIHLLHYYFVYELYRRRKLIKLAVKLLHEIITVREIAVFKKNLKILL